MSTSASRPPSSATAPPLSRRSFVRRAAAFAAAPIFVPATALGRGGRPAPSERITLGCIGVGGMGTGNMNSFLGQDDCQALRPGGMVHREVWSAEALPLLQSIRLQELCRGAPRQGQGQEHGDDDGRDSRTLHEASSKRAMIVL